MKNLIRRWLDIPTREELYNRIDQKVMSKANKHYDKLRKSDRERYRQLINLTPTKTDEQ